MTDAQQDMWAQWILKRRFGGDPELMKKMFDFLYPIRDKVLSQEVLTPSEAGMFANHMRSLVEAGRGTRRSALAYLWAVK